MTSPLMWNSIALTASLTRRMWPWLFKYNPSTRTLSTPKTLLSLQMLPFTFILLCMEILGLSSYLFLLLIVLCPTNKDVAAASSLPFVLFYIIAGIFGTVIPVQCAYFSLYVGEVAQLFNQVVQLENTILMKKVTNDTPPAARTFSRARNTSKMTSILNRLIPRSSLLLNDDGKIDWLGLLLYSANFIAIPFPFLVSVLIPLIPLDPTYHIAKMLFPKFIFRCIPFRLSFYLIRVIVSFMICSEISRITLLFIHVVMIWLKICMKVLDTLKVTGMKGSSSEVFLALYWLYTMGDLLFILTADNAALVMTGILSGLGLCIIIGNVAIVRLFTYIPFVAYVFIAVLLVTTTGFAMKLITFSINIHERSKDVTQAWKTAAAAAGLKLNNRKFNMKKMKSLQPWKSYCGLVGYFFFYFKQSTLFTYNDAVINHTITALLSIPEEWIVALGQLVVF